MKAQFGIWNTLMDHYFRLELDGFENLPDEPCLLIGIHSGAPLTMDVWTPTLSWPLSLALHLTPFQHIPLLAKIRTQIMDPSYLDTDPKRLDDQKYVEAMYHQVESRIQTGMDELDKYWLNNRARTTLPDAGFQNVT